MATFEEAQERIRQLERALLKLRAERDHFRWRLEQVGGLVAESLKATAGAVIPPGTLQPGDVVRVEGQLLLPDPVTGLVSAQLSDDLDEPDLAQAPTNLGNGPVPLFLDGEDPEDEVVIDTTRPQELKLRAVVKRAPEDEDLEEGLAVLERAYRNLAYVAPELWSQTDARIARRYHELRGEPVPESEVALLNRLDPPRAVLVRQASDSEQLAALESTLETMVEQGLFDSAAPPTPLTEGPSEPPTEVD